MKVHATDPEPDVIAEAAAIIVRGGLVAFPTETVYGLGGNALDAEAIAAIFRAKGRPPTNPLIVHVPDVSAAQEFVAAWPDSAARAADAFWPGPLTLVLRKRDHVPDTVTAGLGSVAVRVPAHPVALALLRAAAVPVAAPSANRFTRLSPTTAEHVARGLGERVDLVLDGGATPVGIESTVVDLTGPEPVLLRPGIIGVAELEPVLGPVRIRTEGVATGTAAPAPGMLERHYSPAARLVLYHDVTEAARRVAAQRAAGAVVGVIGHHAVPDGADHPLVLPGDPAGYARLLYAALHSLDDAGCDVILVEAVPDDAAWAALTDRLRRAAD